ncbi:SAM-dependent chlorinase/fluorinase [bacterium]|nr:SAM-dependent chlorinase/fluorinase [bacterium]
MIMKQHFNIFFVILLCLSILGCAKFTPEEKGSWDKAYNSSTKERFIPVELFTGGEWDGKHELILKEASTIACASVTGKKRPCDNIYITGPFKTEINNTQIEWAGDEISYYRRTFRLGGGEVESFFTINNSKDGLVRIYDKRKQWGARTYNGLGSKFPLGYWKQGEVRSYASSRPTSIEIIELDGPNHCLTFRWKVGLGKGRNSDNNYTFCPDRGFTNISHNNTIKQVGAKMAVKVISLGHQQVTVNNGVIKGNISTLDPKFGNVWTNIHQEHLKQVGIKLGDTLCVLVKEDNIIKLDTKLPYIAAFDKVAVGKPLVYVNNLSNVSFALNQGDFSTKNQIAYAAKWNTQIKQCN